MQPLYFPHGKLSLKDRCTIKNTLPFPDSSCDLLYLFTPQPKTFCLLTMSGKLTLGIIFDMVLINTDQKYVCQILIHFLVLLK